jgi:hypothetical protein
MACHMKHKQGCTLYTGHVTGCPSVGFRGAFVKISSSGCAAWSGSGVLWTQELGSHLSVQDWAASKRTAAGARREPMWSQSCRKIKFLPRQGKQSTVQMVGGAVSAKELVWFKWRGKILFKSNIESQVPVTHSYNPSYLEGWDLEDPGSRPVWANNSWDSISKTTRAKWIGAVAQAVELSEFELRVLSSNSSPTKKKKSNIVTFRIITCSFWYYLKNVDSRKMPTIALLLVTKQA